MKHFICTIIGTLLVGSLLSFRPIKNEKSKVTEPTSLISELEQLFSPELLSKYRTEIVEQESSYDRTGNNDDGFSGRYSFIRKEGDKLVLLDVKGPGVINRIWTPTPTSDTIQFYFDGEKTPRISIPFIDLFSGNVHPFINPICGNEVGGYYCYLPIQYNKSLKVMYKGERIQFHQIQYRPYPDGSVVKSFNSKWEENELAALNRAAAFWSGQVNPLTYSQLINEMKDVKVENKQFFLSPGETVPFFSKNEGGRILGMELDFGEGLKGTNKDVLLQAQWDKDENLAINCPAADFFGYAFGKPAMQSILIGNADGINYSYLPMPFSQNAEMKLVYEKRNSSQSSIDVKARIYYTTEAQNSEKEGRLYTIWRREIEPKNGESYLMAKIEDKGHLVGVIQQAQGLNPGMTLFFEGDDSIVIDNKMRMHGTGSEDFYNGGWYALLDRWDRGVSLPIHGSLDYSLQMARTGGYRFYMGDKLTFNKNMLLAIEHGPEHNLIPVDYTSVAFYYGSKPTLSDCQLSEKLRTIYYPTTHIFYTQLMNFALGLEAKIENKGSRIIASTENEGIVRIMIEDIPEGKYRIKLTYLNTPDGGEFSVWNRQKKLTDWKTVYSTTEERIEKQELGVVDITRHTNSISIHLRKTERGSKFHFEQLQLEKL